MPKKGLQFVRLIYIHKNIHTLTKKAVYIQTELI